MLHDPSIPDHFEPVPLHQVFDNYAVTVMIGEDPYTLGLFDTAGSFFFLSQLSTNICICVHQSIH